jgi:DNA-binding ferritin-like protein (Dps family)
MTMFTSKFATMVIGDKRRWKQYKARVKQLPESYRTVVDALERYLMYFGPADSANATAMFEDLADLFEQSAAAGTPIREIVGDDPMEFIEAFLRNYPEGSWLNREKERLISAIERAAGEETGQGR